MIDAQEILEYACGLYRDGKTKEAETIVGLLVAAHGAGADINRHNVRSYEVEDMSLCDGISYDQGPEPPEPRAYRPLFPFEWTKCLVMEHKSSKMPRISGAMVYAFGWPNAYSGISETFQVFSGRKWHVHGEWWRAMIGVGPFMSSFRTPKGIDNALVSLSAMDITEHRGKYTLIGSQRNWGHWTIDHLAYIPAARALPDASERKLVFGMLTPKQRDCIRHMGVRDEEIVELKSAVMDGSINWFEDLAVPYGYPVRRRADNLRKWASRVASPGDGPRKVYITRTDGRIANKQDVDDLFARRGFEVIDDLPSRPLDEQMRIITRADVLALPYGSDMLSAAMCKIDALVIALIPKMNYRAGLTTDWISIEFGPSMRPVYGSQVKSLEEPCEYDIKSIASVIDLC